MQLGPQYPILEGFVGVISVCSVHTLTLTKPETLRGRKHVLLGVRCCPALTASPTSCCWARTGEGTEGQPCPFSHPRMHQAYQGRRSTNRLPAAELDLYLNGEVCVVTAHGGLLMFALYLPVNRTDTLYCMVNRSLGFFQQY